jgi:glycerophosphoryl diester phosphodiesterase
VLLLGHRGARRCAAENTIAAFELCLAHGCDGFEFDVRRSADGAAVICNDERIGGAAVVEASYAELLRRQPSLATLDQVLERFSARAYLYIELKTEGAEEALLRALALHPPQRGFVVASFVPEIIQAVHARDGSLPLGLIADTRRSLFEWRNLPVSAVMPHHSLANHEVIGELRAAGKFVFPWTVNRASQMKALAASGVEGLLSDDTALLVQTLRPAPDVGEAKTCYSRRDV